MTLAATWAAAFFAYAAVWKTSEELGIGTWWLGARSSPTPVIVRIIPFTALMLICFVFSYVILRFAFPKVAAVAFSTGCWNSGLAALSRSPDIMWSAAAFMRKMAGWSTIATVAQRAFLV